jgi:hypothetical protein
LSDATKQKDWDVMTLYRSRVPLTSWVVALGLLANVAILGATVGVAPAGGSAVPASRAQPRRCDGTTTAAGVCLIPPLTLTDTVPAPATAARAVAARPRYAG